MASKNNVPSDGPATTKRFKITKAQRSMFIFVCGASLVLGVTAVLCIFFIKSIVYENKLIEQKEYVVEALKGDQESLEGMSAQIDELSSNEYLESVATSRSNSFDCNEVDWENLSASGTSDQVEKLRSCSSLRVIHDAMPSTSNTITLDDVDATTRVQFALIVNDAGINSYSRADTAGYSLEDSSYVSDDASSAGLIEPYSSFDLSVDMSSDLTMLKTYLSTVDKSIRNFDLRSATLSLDTKSNGVSFKGTYSGYYTNPVSLQIMERLVCADKKNEKCIAQGGDQSVTKGNGGKVSN